VSNWNERTPSDRAAHDLRVRGTAPADCSDDEFTAALWRATDASLRQDPERWVTASASGRDRHPADRSESGIKAYARDARDARRKCEPTEPALPPPRRPPAPPPPSVDPRWREVGLRGWETRRAREAARGASRPLLTHAGETLTVAEWATRTGMRAATIRARLAGGCTVEEALTLPRGTWRSQAARDHAQVQTPGPAELP
jgi:hypothetical protein